MLNITAQRNAEGAKSYFAKSDYYSQGQEIVGRWGGKGAVLLGLFGSVEKQAFNALCDNLHPRTGEPLTALTRADRRVGYDFTWSAPKSVSIVHALTGDERIITAFCQSIRETMTEMEADMETRVRKGGQEHDRLTGNLVYAEFIHKTSRPVAGVPCPQLHSHAFVLNGTYDAVESQWKAGNFGRIKESGYYWQAVQQARFASALQKLGYGIQRTKHAFEIEGVPQAAIHAFSLRTQLIDNIAAKLGITDAKSKAKLAATTRENKLGNIPYAELVSTWEKMVSADARDAILASRGKAKSQPTQDAAHVKYAIDHEFERSSVVDERRLLTVALRHGLGEVTPEGVRAEANRQALLKRVEERKTWVTTQQVLAEETRMLRYAVAGKGTCPSLGKPDGSWRETLRQSLLSGEQQAAVAHLLTSPDAVMILRGVAGSGKTTLTTQAVQEIRAGGTPVLVAAPTVKAVEVLKEDGFDAQTLARLLIDPKLQETAKNGVIWVDEAGLIGSKAMAELFAVADNIHARVILAGDKKQLAAVERGSPLRVLESLGGLKIAEVKQIRRQRGDYREAVKLLSEGKAAESLDKLESMGCIRLLPGDNDYCPIAKEYADHLQLASAKDRDKAALIVCPTHTEGEKINDAVRDELRKRGLITGGERMLKRLVPMQWTGAQRGDAGQYATGAEILQFHHNSGRFKAGERVTAEEAIAQGGLAKPEHFAVYAESIIGISQGDLLRATAKGKTRDGRHTISNGGVYRVKGFDRQGDLVLSNGWTVAKDHGHWSHAYVNTAYASQGRTVNHAIVAQSAISYPAVSKESFYVAVSRGKESVSVYVDDARHLREAVGKTQARPSATELAAKPKPQLWRRMRQAMANVQQAAYVAAKSAMHQMTVQRQEFAYER